MKSKKFQMKPGANPVQHFPNNIGRVDLSTANDAFIEEHIEIISHLVEEVKAKTTEGKPEDKKA